MTDQATLEDFQKPVSEPIDIYKLSKDLRNASKLLTDSEARYLVDGYYQIQKSRIAASHQAGTQLKNNEPTEFLNYTSNNLEILEGQIRYALDKYSLSRVEGKWLQSIHGVGPVIAAGLLSAVNLDKTYCVAALWRFAGLDPTLEWKKGNKRPYNAQLKTLCYKVGECFVRAKNMKGDYYGKFYNERKAIEISKNENFDFKDQAASKLAKFNISKSTDAYEWYSKGLLPPAHIHARARRHMVKLFLSHFYMVAYFCRFGQLPALPYAIAQLGHVHIIPIPRVDMVPGLEDAFRNWRSAV